MVVVSANGLMQKSADTIYPFRQESNFFYLTGIKVPDILLVMDGNKEFLVLPKRTYAENIFGGELNCDEIAKHSGIKKIYKNREGWDRIKILQRRRKKIYTILAPPVKVVHTDSFFTNPARRQLLAKLRRLNNQVEFLDVRLYLTKMRQIKQSEEIKAIKQAIDITYKGFERAKQHIKIGVSGQELKAELDYEFTKLGASHGFDPIITNGPDTCLHHLQVNQRKLAPSEAILFDIGAEFEYYTADVSRTFFSPQPTKRQLAVHEAVRRVQHSAENLVKPGVLWKDYAVKVDELMGEELIRLGLITKNNRNQVRRYFSHSIGHSLGLDAHDPCDYGGEFEENMIITIEPGIYIPQEGFGVRIEDDYLIGKTGVSNMSSHINYV